MSASEYFTQDQLDSCRLLSVTNLNASYNYLIPGSGLGATLTNAGSLGSLSVDGIAVNVSDRIAVAGQTDGSQNGIYTVLNIGSTFQQWVLQRASDFQSPGQFKEGSFFTIGAGNLYAGETVVLVEPIPATFGVDSINFTRASFVGLGQAAFKGVTDNTQLNVASVDGSFVVNNLLAAADSAGSIKDSGVSPSDATKTKLASVNGATVVGHTAVFSDTLGTIIDGGPEASGTVGAGTIHQVAAYPVPGNAVLGVSVLQDASGANSVNWMNRQLLANDGTTVKMDYSNPNDILFKSTSGTEFEISQSANPGVNWIKVNGAITGNSPLFTSVGSDANVNMTFMTKGSGAFSFSSGIGGILTLIPVSASVNSFVMFNSITNNPPILGAIGGDTNINLQLQAKGTGVVFTHNSFSAFGFQVTEGSNAKQGIATLIAGTVTVSNTSVTSNSRIFLTPQDNNTVGALRVSARTAATNFVITSSLNTDTGVVAYEIFEPGV